MPESSNDGHAMLAKATESGELESLRARVATLEAACAEAQHSVETIITYAPEAFVLLDIETGRFLEANPMAEQLFGFPRAKLLNMGPIELSPSHQPDGPSSRRGNEKIAEAVAGGVPVFEWWHCNARGERIPCEIRLVKVRYQGRDVIRGTLVDISSRKRLELSERGRHQILENIARGASLKETLGSLVRAGGDPRTC